MIAADTSSLIAFIQDEAGSDVDRIIEATKNNLLILPPVVVSELLSDLTLPKFAASAILGLPVLEILPGYWLRVGKLRALLLSKKLKACLADALIAQSCLDYQVPLITRDKDFRHFKRYASLMFFE